MSWSLSVPKDSAASVARDKVKEAYMPDSIKAYIDQGLQALQDKHKDPDVRVVVNAYGHVCTGEDYEVTSASITVAPSPKD